MSRIRTIKPKFFKNEDLAALSRDWRLLFIGLWTQADREGRLEDRPKRLKAELFPYDDDLDVNAGLGSLINAGFLTRYEVKGIRYLAVSRWLKHQRPQASEPPSELPAPLDDRKDHADHENDHVDHDHRKNDHEIAEQMSMIATISRRQEGKGVGEGNGKGSKDHARRARFERFWQSYPRKVAKDAAWRVWERLDPDDALTDVMLAEVQRQARSEQWREERFIPHPRTWLHQGRWQDAPTVKPLSPEQEHVKRSREVVRLIREEGLSPAEASARMGFK